MIKYCIPFILILTACSIPVPKPRTFVCATALGAGELSTANPDVQLHKDFIEVKQERETFFIPRSACVEVVER